MTLSATAKLPKHNHIETVIWWFSDKERITWHIVARIFRSLFSPLIRLALGIAIKWLLGYNISCSAAENTQLVHLRRYISNSLLSQATLKAVFEVLGTHYEATSCIFRAMGAKIGKRVYWPGSGVYCPDPELLEIGDDVVFGSRSELFTTDAIGSGKIIVGAGAMIADRCVLLPGVTVGRNTVMGSGCLTKRGAHYADNSTWIGSRE
jgi:acetyltransferase-like isoleucine patch superfamily enzyme